MKQPSALLPLFGLLGACTSRALEAPASEALAGSAERPADVRVERISTAVLFPRGLVIEGDTLYALCRGRVRDYGGVSAEIDDEAGTIYTVDPTVAEVYAEVRGGAVVPPESGPGGQGGVSEAVRANGEVLARPTDPPFKLWDRTASPPSSDRETDRPYCTLRFDTRTRNFFVCAFSGIDKAKTPGGRSFSKNLTDALLRYDLRTGRWHEVERHDIEAGGIYPHHDSSSEPPPHGWLNGPDNCLVVGDWLYAVAKDNSVLVRYDLRPLAGDPEAGPPPSEVVLGREIAVRGLGTMRFEGHSMLAEGGGYLYLGFRTSSEIVRLPLDARGLPVQPIQAELVARFDPYDRETGRSANLTDMDMGPDGALYVISAVPARVYRFRPDPERVYDARGGARAPWADLAAITANPRMKSENLLVAPDGRVYVTSGDSYDVHAGTGGVIWRLTPLES